MRKNLSQQFQNETNNLTDSVGGQSIGNSKLQLNTEPKMNLSAMMIQSQNSINENTCFDQNNNAYDTQSKINYISDGTDYNRQPPHFVNTEQKRNYERNHELEENIHRQANQTRYQSLFKRFLQREKFDTTLSCSIQNSVFKSQSKDMEMNKIKEFLIASAQQESNLNTMTNQNNTQNNLTLDEKLTKISEKIEKEFEKDLQTIQKSSQQIIQQSQILSSSSVSPSLHAKSQKNTNRRYLNDFNSQIHSSKQSPTNKNTNSQFESNEFPLHTNITNKNITQYDTQDADNEYYSSIIKTDVDSGYASNPMKQKNSQDLQKKRSQSQIRNSKNEDRIFNEILGRNSQYIAEYEQNRVNKSKLINQSHDKSLQDDTYFLNKNTTNLEFSITKNNETDFLTKRNSRPNSNRLLQKSDLQVFAEILDTSYMPQNKTGGIINSTSISNTNTNLQGKDSIGQTTQFSNNHNYSNFQIDKLTGRSSPEQSICKRNNSKSSKNSSYQTRENTNCMVSRQHSPENHQIDYKDNHTISQMSSQQEENNLTYQNISKTDVNCLKQILMHDLNYNKESNLVNDIKSNFNKQFTNRESNQTKSISDVSSVNQQDQNNQKEFEDFQDYQINPVQVNQTIQEVGQEDEEDTVEKIGNLEKEESLSFQKNNINNNHSLLQNINSLIQPSFRISDSSNKKSVITPHKQNNRNQNYNFKNQSSAELEYDYEQIKVDDRNSRPLNPSDLLDSNRETRVKKLQNTDYESSCNDISAISMIPKTQQSNYSQSNKKIQSNQKREKPFLTLEADEDDDYNGENKVQFQNQNSHLKNFGLLKENGHAINSFSSQKVYPIQKIDKKDQSLNQNYVQLGYNNRYNQQNQISQSVNQNLQQNVHQQASQNSQIDDKENAGNFQGFEDKCQYPKLRALPNTGVIMSQEKISNQFTQPNQYQNQLALQQNTQQPLNNFQNNHFRNKSSHNSSYQYQELSEQCYSQKNYPSVRLSWNQISSQKEKEGEKNNNSLERSQQNVCIQQDQKLHLQNILKEKMQSRLDYYQNGQLIKLISSKEQEALHFIKQNNLRQAVQILDSCEKELLKDIPIYDPHKIIIKNTIEYCKVTEGVVNTQPRYKRLLNLKDITLLNNNLSFSPIFKNILLYYIRYIYYLLVECLYNSQRYAELQRVCSLFYGQYQNYKFEDPKMFSYCIKILNYYVSVLIEEDLTIDKCIIILQKLLDILRQNNSKSLETESLRQQIQQMEEVDIVLKLVQCYMKIKEFKQAIKCLSELIPILKNHQNTKILLVFKRKAQCLSLLHQEQESEKTLEEALNYSESNFKIHKQDDFILLSELYEELARIKFKQSNFIESVQKFQQAIKILKNLDAQKFQDKIALLLAEQGKGLVKIEEFQAAQQNYLDAYNIITQTKGKYTQSATDCLLSIAKIYYKQKKYNSSVEVHETVLQMYQKMVVKKTDIKFLKLILLILEQCLEGQINAKYEYYETLLKEIINQNYKKENSFIIANEVGNLLRKFQLNEGAIYYYQKAVNEIYPELKIQDSTKSQLILVMCNLASSYSSLQRYLQSLDIYQQALKESIRFHGQESSQTLKIQQQIRNLHDIIQQKSQK